MAIMKDVCTLLSYLSVAFSLLNMTTVYNEKLNGLFSLDVIQHKHVAEAFSHLSRCSYCLLLKCIFKTQKNSQDYSL